MRPVILALAIGLVGWFLLDENLREGRYTTEQIILGLSVFGLVYGAAFINRRKK